IACERANVPHRYKEWTGKGSLTSLVILLNLNRRHLSDQQRALIAAKAKPHFAQEAKKRMEAGTLASIEARGKSAAKAAEAFNVSRTAVERATRVTRDATPEVVEAVHEDKISLTAAEELSKLTPAEQIKAINEEVTRTEKAVEKDRRKALLGEIANNQKKL